MDSHTRVRSWQSSCSSMEEIVPPHHSGVAQRELSLKLLVLGDMCVGKTALVKRYVHNVFHTGYKETIGVDFSIKQLQLSPDFSIKLQLWDVAGMERLGALTRAYYRNAHGCLLMFDLTEAKTLQSAINWKEDLDSKCRLADGSTIPCLLLGNKSDLPNSQSMAWDDVSKISERYGFCSWRSISVKENKGVDEAVGLLTQEMISRTQRLGEQRVKTVAFTPSKKRSETAESSIVNLQAPSPPKPAAQSDCSC